MFKRISLLISLTISVTYLLAQSTPQALHRGFAAWEGRSASPKAEVRAVWLTTLNGLDWPKRIANTEPAAQAQREELCRMLDRLQAAGINTVMFQSRVRATTAYPSAIEPWDGAFTGEPGRAPLYDPLQFAIDECHRRGMELHAWVVAFPICKDKVAKKLGKKALPRLRPELCQRCGDQWMMDPGVPGTDDYIAAICSEIVERYAVDGIHLDYIRYPERGISFNDNRTYKKYGKGMDKKAWRSANVDRCVKKIHDAVKRIRPWVKLSCSPVGKYADLPRQSSYGWNARDAVSQDAQAWLEKGWMDMLFPMMYFDGKHFYPFAYDWQENAHGRLVVPGLGIYFLHKREKDWPLSAIQRQMYVVREAGLGGQALFRAKFLDDNVKGLYDFVAQEFYSRPVPVPPMTWADSIAPTMRPMLEVDTVAHSLQLRWQPATDNTPGAPIYYRVYRMPSPDASLSEAYVLSLRVDATSFAYTPVLPEHRYATYAVTAVDAYGNESPPQIASIVGQSEVGNDVVTTSDKLRFHLEQEPEFLLFVDGCGQLVTTRLYNTTVDVSDLAPGFYEVRTLDTKGQSRRVYCFCKR